ncbi:hypothetical protein EYF80_010152 [Liparis tanakae]|uniref:Uncharacterized protein n=1 Tax=Liparis tanakae TaxID=230148 RepID=A0A4Z2INE0_9TELE|nr:hypothetical protein EYF80_010152 [Liparis tanakae]
MFDKRPASCPDTSPERREKRTDEFKEKINQTDVTVGDADHADHPEAEGSDLKGAPRLRRLADPQSEGPLSERPAPPPTWM